MMWNLRSAPQADNLWALLVYEEEEPVRAVEQILRGQAMSTRRVRNCYEAMTALRHSDQPALVVTDASLPDGDWADVLRATRTCTSSPPLIVVSRLADIQLYLDVMESGAYDFVVPPLASAEMAYVVSGALLKRSDQGPGKPRNSGPSSARRAETPAGANR
jgi:two-component system, response regulator, stage 0 sporulation protein F